MEGKLISAIILIGGDYDKKLLEKCLASLSWADEIIKVETNKIPGSFSEWRNYGAQKATGDWLFYVDSDEEVTEELRNEIEIEKTNYVAYTISRRNFIFDKEFKYGGQRPDYVKRLFLKSKFRGWRGELHEEPSFDGKMGHLDTPLIHHKNIDLSQMVVKTNEWSEIEAKLMYEAGHPGMNFFRFFSAGAREFWLRMIKQTAFLDGREGIIYALYQVYSRLISYAKLWEKQLSTIRT
ncbi:MAG: glycosyltransferase family 2 protein [Patescibacteria group bacterium]